MKRLIIAAVSVVLMALPAWGANLTDNGDGTISDADTTLLWQQADDGVQRTWEEAISYCEGLSLAGRTDWRLPNYKALQSIVDNNRGAPTIDPLFTGTKIDTDYWSSTTGFTTNPQYPVALTVWFERGQGAQQYKINPYFYARCVSGGVTSPSLALTTATATVREADGVATFTVSRGGSSAGAVSVDYATGSGGTATVGSDYALASGTLTWDSGDMADKTFTVSISADGEAEGEETVHVLLSNPRGAGATLGTTSTAVLTIDDSTVAVLDSWNTIYASAPKNSAQTDLEVGNFAVGSGVKRLLLVAVTMGRSSLNMTPTSISATYGGVPLLPLAITSGSAKEHMWVGYLTDAQLGAGSQSLKLSYTVSENTVSSLHVKTASYRGVNQDNPFRGVGVQMSMLTDVYFPSLISYDPGGMTVVVAGNNTATGTVAVLGGVSALPATPAFVPGVITTANSQQSTTLATTTHLAAGSYGPDTFLRWSGTSSARFAMVVFSLRP